MKIVHIQDYFHPQLGYQETFIMRVQRDAGHEVHMVTSNRNIYSVRDGSDTGNVLGARVIESKWETIDDFQVHRLPCKFPFLQKFYRLWLAGLEDQILTIDPDLVIVHGMQSITSFRIAKLSGKERTYKLIFDSHAAKWNSARKFHNLYYRYYRTFQSDIYMQSADAIIAIDRWSKDFLIQECGINSDLIQIVPLGADHTVFKFNPDHRASKRREWGVDSDSTVFLYIGKMLPVKGVHYFLEAVIETGKKHDGISAVIVGSGDSRYIEKMQQLADSQDRVKSLFLPHVPNPEIPAIYSGADVSVWPMEVSIGTLEAQSCGVPLIVADEEVLEERISYGNGISYDKGNVADLTSKMNYLIENPGDRKNMGRLGRLAIEQELNWEIITQNFMQSVEMEL